MKQSDANILSNAIHDFRDAESLTFAVAPFKDVPELSKIKGSKIGVRIILGQTERKETLLSQLTNALVNTVTPLIEDHLQIDYIEIVRAKTEEECAAIEIVEPKEKRELWVNE